MQLLGDCGFVYMCTVALCMFILYRTSIWVITTLRKNGKIKRRTFIKSTKVIMVLFFFLTVYLWAGILPMDLYLKHYESILLLWTSRFAIVLWLIFYILLPIEIMNNVFFHKKSTILFIITVICMLSLLVAGLMTLAALDPDLFITGMVGMCIMILICYNHATETKSSASAADD